MVRTQVYGAWLYRGEWDGHTPPPLEGWELLHVVPGRYTNPPRGLEPKQGQVTLLMHGETCTVVTPEEEA